MLGPNTSLSSTAPTNCSYEITLSFTRFVWNWETLLLKWISLWHCKPSDLLKALPHSSHLYGLSPVWIRSWAFQCEYHWNSLPQLIQLYLHSLLLELVWEVGVFVYKWTLFTNLPEHEFLSLSLLDFRNWYLISVVSKDCISVNGILSPTVSNDTSFLAHLITLDRCLTVVAMVPWFIGDWSFRLSCTDLRLPLVFAKSETQLSDCLESLTMLEEVACCGIGWNGGRDVLQSEQLVINKLLIQSFSIAKSPCSTRKLGILIFLYNNTWYRKVKVRVFGCI